MSLKKKKSQGKAVKVTVNSKRKTLKTFVWTFVVQEFGLWPRANRFTSFLPRLLRLWKYVHVFLAEKAKGMRGLSQIILAAKN